MVSVTLRDAVLDDMAALRDVFRRSSLSNAGDRPNLLAHPEVLEYSDGWVRQGLTRLAMCEGKVVGFATAVPRDGALELEDLFVDPDWMRNGVARALIRDSVSRARAASVHRINVTANTHALDFYQAVGFVRGGVAETRFGSASRMHLDVEA